MNGSKAQSNNPQTWTDYQTACEHLHKFSGIGFVFSEDAPHCGIDLDNCLDENGKVKKWARPIVDRLAPVSYGDVSPSGNGIKFWTKARLPELAKHKVYIAEPTGEAIEAYDSGRYFTVTGKGKGTIGEGQAVIDWLVQEYLTPIGTTPTRPVSQRPANVNLSSREVISRIRESKQAHKFDALMRGNTTGYGSQSEADLALCAVVAFWSQEHAVIDTIFRTSGLMRAKWDKKHRADGSTYGTMTIKEALSGKRETYQPKRKPYSPARRRLNRTQELYGGRG